MAAGDSPLEHPADVYRPFDASESKRLRTYAEDVSTLVAFRFFQGPKLSVTIAEPGIGDTLEGPDEEAVYAVAALFRSLYLDHEPTSYNAILKLLSRSVRARESPTQREATDELRSLRRLKARALSAGMNTITSSGRELTPEVLIDVFLNTTYLHKDDTKMDALEDLQGDAFLMFEFLGAVQRLSQVFWVGRLVVSPILKTASLLQP